MSQSEGGFEGVYQSSAVVPRWVIVAGPDRRWEVRISWTLDRARPTAEREEFAAHAVEMDFS